MLFDFETLPALERYKLLTATVTPRPIAWVTSADAEGRLNAAPFSFFNVFAGDPPILGIGIGTHPPDRRKDTQRNIRETKEFTVNLVSRALAEKMNVTAIEFPHEANELDEAALATAPSVRIAPPRIADAPVSFECTLFQLVELGPRDVLVLGRVLALHVRDDAVLDPVRHHIDTPKLDLIGRLEGRGWYTRTQDRFEIDRIPLDAWRRRAAT